MRGEADPVWVPLTPAAKRVRVDVAKGLDYVPVSVEADVSADPVELTARLRRWNRLREDGWRAADAHLHYDRIEPAADHDWFAMMAGDDVAHTQFMTLKGGMVRGVWAEQFAFGERGEAVADGRTIVAGEEYRDRLQGHILLFGLGKLIQPITTGGPDSPNNFPALATVLNRARNTGGLVGTAHGGTLGSNPTAGVGRDPGRGRIHGDCQLGMDLLAPGHLVPATELRVLPSTDSGHRFAKQPAARTVAAVSRRDANVCEDRG